VNMTCIMSTEDTSDKIIAGLEHNSLKSLTPCTEDQGFKIISTKWNKRQETETIRDNGDVWTAAFDPATEGILKLKNWNKINKDSFSTSQKLYCMDIHLLQSHQEYKCNSGKVTKSAVTYVSFICKVFGLQVYQFWLQFDSQWDWLEGSSFKFFCIRSSVICGIAENLTVSVTFWLKPLMVSQIILRL
jgi:hypothetical protein